MKRWLPESLGRPDRPSQGPILIAATVWFGVMGAVFVTIGAIYGNPHTILNGSFWIFWGVITYILTMRRYPRGFELPENIDPKDRQQIKAAVKRYRQERHSDR